MDDRAALILLRTLCTAGPQKLSAVDRGRVDNLVARGLASITKRGLAVGATSLGYALHRETANPSMTRIG